MADTKKKKKKQSQLGMIMKRLRKNKVAMTGLVILMIMILMAVFAPLIAPYDPTEMDFSATYATPSLKHLFGCDELGRDILSRLIYGARYSLSLGLISALIGMVLGLFFGTWIGFEGGKVDMFWMRIMDIWSAIPGQLLAIVISTALGAGFVNTIIAMTIGGIPGSIRSSRAMCLKEREMEYLEAAKIINCSKFKIMYVHMLPNIVAPAIVGTTMAVGITIMGAAGLSYIGLGIQPPSPEWGAMLSAGRTYILQYPHMIVFPGIFLAITVLAINLLGDGLRDAIDPKNK
ncbi:MAG: ABC transporter permease [Butyrivibrio sp.]|nr:ABC transporter permease [Butyrivibrio sp.]